MQRPFQLESKQPSQLNTNASTSEAPSTNNDDANIAKVKDSTLDFDNTVKIGPAIEGYSFFKDVSWSNFQTPQGRIIVEVTAHVDLNAFQKSVNQDNPWIDELIQKTNPQVQYTAQFSLSQIDSGITVKYSGYTVHFKDSLSQYNHESADKELKGLKSIFANEVDSFLLNQLQGDEFWAHNSLKPQGPQ